MFAQDLDAEEFPEQQQTQPLAALGIREYAEGGLAFPVLRTGRLDGMPRGYFANPRATTVGAWGAEYDIAAHGLAATGFSPVYIPID